MTRSEVRSHFNETPRVAQFEDGLTFDSFNETLIQCFYDSADTLARIRFYDPTQVDLGESRLVGMPYQSVIALLDQLGTRRDLAGWDFYPELGLTIVRDGSRVKCVDVSRSNLYDDLLAQLADLK